MTPISHRWYPWALGLAVILGGSLGAAVQTAASEMPAELEIELSDLLHSGLRTRLPEEKEFVDHVVERVAENKLPLDLVLGTFLWARRRQPYPFPYFERGLRVRAARQGFPIYASDRSPSFRQRSVFDQLRVR